MTEEEQKKNEIPHRMSRIAFPKAKYGLYLDIFVPYGADIYYFTKYTWFVLHSNINLYSESGRCKKQCYIAFVLLTCVRKWCIIVNLWHVIVVGEQVFFLSTYGNTSNSSDYSIRVYIGCY